jgi:putative nucleotidyltransferase with HDIG domain
MALRVQTRDALLEIADMVDLRDHYTFEHSRHVAKLARATAEAMGLSRDVADVIEMAGRVHDVGKIGIKSTVLMKPSHLTDREWSEMRSHPVLGAKIVSKFPQFERGKDIVLAHHERFDGKGYPNKLARVLAVADAWDAMTSHRAYRAAMPRDRVFAELERGRGTQFDPRALDAFLKVLATHPELSEPRLGDAQDVDVATDDRECAEHVSA